MARPGIMIYFDIREPIKWLPDADKGRLFDAILEYGEHGTVPEFDGMLAMAWGFIKPKLDKDCDSYENSKAQRQYAAFCKKRSAAGLGKILFEDWADMDEEERRWRATSDNGPLVPVNGPLAFVDGRYPSTSTSTTAATSTATSTATSPSTSTSTTASSAAAAAKFPYETDEAAAAAEAKRKKLMGGKLGKGVVMLSGYETDRLIDRMGIDMFDYYTEKLANYIINKKATVVNHYETILKWYTEDMG